MAPRSVLPTPAEMIAHLDRHVAGQERAKRALATAVYRHYLGLAARGRYGAGRGFGPQHALVLGPTGSGKTFMVRLLADLLGVPVLLTSATTLVETGYVGDHVETLFQHLLARAGGVAARAERGIVFLDEIDKIRASRDGFRDVSGEGVQNALLTVLDGRRVQARSEGGGAEVDASSVLFIAAGAFVGLEEHVARRLGGAPALGFRGTGTRTPTRGDGRAAGGALHQVLPEDLVRFGFIPEFIGRFPTVVAVDPLGEDELVHILEATEDSVVRRERELFALHGLELVFTPDGLRALARDAQRRGTGARGLATRVRELLQPVTWRLPELDAEGVRAVVVDAATVAGGAPELVRGRRRGEPPLADHLRADAFTPCAAGAAAPAERMAATEARERLRWMRDHVLGWEHAGAAARAWWEALLQEHFKRPQALVRFASELMSRKATLAEAHEAARAAACPSPAAWLAMLDYRRARAEWERESAEALRREERRRRRSEAEADDLRLPLDGDVAPTATGAPVAPADPPPSAAPAVPGDTVAA